MTQRVGIIGWPLTTTFSPAMHNAAFLYSDDLGEAVQAFMQKRPAAFKGR